MKKKFEEPKIEFIPLDSEDIITTSGFTPEDIKPGHGYGDKNHEHIHWKDMMR